MQLVHAVVALQHIARERTVAAHERVERIGEHVRGDAHHLLDLRDDRERRCLHQPAHALGDVDGVVAHPLEIARDLHRHGDEAEVPRHGLLQREQVDRVVLDLHLERVDRIVVLDDLRGLRHVARQQRAHRLAHRVLRQSRHADERGLQAVQVILEVAVRAHPNLPVM